MTLPLPSFIAAVEAITHASLPADDILEAMKMRNRGITPEEFAYWISLLASPSAIPPGTPLPQDGVSAPSRLPDAGRGKEFEKEIA
jgi:hypothetical protein